MARISALSLCVSLLSLDVVVAAGSSDETGISFWKLLKQAIGMGLLALLATRGEKNSPLAELFATP